MLKPISVNENIIGHFGRLGTTEVFFGTRHGDLETVQKHFDITIKFIKQVHGDKIIASAPLEADAHWTKLRGMPLGIYTADCLPVMISCDKTQRVLAIHAGWRGVRSQIVMKAKDLFLSSGSQPRDLYVAIGPHITEKSFEIETDLGETILAADPTGAITGLPHSRPEKIYISLKSIVRNQLQEIPDSNVFMMSDDTLSNPLYFSHRRKPKEGRLISFILRK